MSQQCTFLSTPEHYALEVSPMRAPWVFLLWWAHYVGGLVGLVGPWSGWLLGPALCRGLWLATPC